MCSGRVAANGRAGAGRSSSAARVSAEPLPLPVAGAGWRPGGGEDRSTLAFVAPLASAMLWGVVGLPGIGWHADVVPFGGGSMVEHLGHSVSQPIVVSGRTDRSQFGARPKLVHCRPKSANVGPTWTESDHTLTNVGRMRSKLAGGRRRAGVGRVWANSGHVGPGSAELGPMPSGVGPIFAQFRPESAHVPHILAEIREMWTNAGRFRPPPWG